MFIPVILGSMRTGRQSPKVASFIQYYLSKYSDITTELVDLGSYNIPLMEERLKYLENPPLQVLKFAEKIRTADAVVVVAPEYNGCYPGVLKNALDYLRDEYKGKIIGLVSVSGGPHGGKSCMEMLTHFFNRLNGTVMLDSFVINNVQTAFSDIGATSEQMYETKVIQLVQEIRQAVLACSMEKIVESMS